MFSCEYCEIFKNTYYEEHLRTAVLKEGDTHITVWKYMRMTVSKKNQMT